jgi:hypothetical protein
MASPFPVLPLPAFSEKACHLAIAFDRRSRAIAGKPTDRRSRSLGRTHLPTDVVR